jgi:hypothetical protein
MNKVYVIEVENNNIDIVKNDQEILTFDDILEQLRQNSERNIDILEQINIIIDKHKDLKICIICHMEDYIHIIYRKLKEKYNSIEKFNIDDIIDDIIDNNIFPTSQIVLINSLLMKKIYNENLNCNFDILIDMIGKSHSILNNIHQKITNILSKVTNENLDYKLYTKKTKYNNQLK